MDIVLMVTSGIFLSSVVTTWPSFALVTAMWTAFCVYGH